MNTINHQRGLVLSCIMLGASSTLAQVDGLSPQDWNALPKDLQNALSQNIGAPGTALTPPPEVLARLGSDQAWRRGSNLEPKAFGQIDEFTYQLRKEDLVRWDNPNINAPLHLEWIQDWPLPIDKRNFRKIDPNSQFDPLHVYVAFKPGTTPEQQDNAHKLVGGSVIWTSEMVPDLYQVTTGGKDVATTVNAYLDLPQVLYAEPCTIMQTLDANDPQYNELWGLLNAEDGASRARLAWDDRGGWTGDPNFVIAVIDTGVQIDCGDLDANRWVNPSPSPNYPYFGTDLYGWNVADDTGDVLSCGDTHGTHVAGTIGAVGNNGLLVTGMNWRCKIMTLRCNGLGNCMGLYNTPIALDYAVSRGAKVSNNSYGSDGLPGQTAYAQLISAQAAGHIFVAAAGNSAADADVSPMYPAAYPLSNIISVAAIRRDATIASFSNFGWNSVDLGAPGVGIVSTIPPCTTESLQGTSMASPHVAGAVALVWGRYPQLEWWKIKQRICEGTFNPYLACAFQSQLNVLQAMGYWVGNPGPLPGPGSFYAPIPWGFLSTAIEATPTYGTLNFHAGMVITNAPQLITKPMTMRSEGPTTLTR